MLLNEAKDQKNGHKVTLSGVSERIGGTLQVTQAEKFLEYLGGP